MAATIKPSAPKLTAVKPTPTPQVTPSQVAPAARESRLKAPSQVVQSRLLVVTGFQGSGKTTLSVSASQYAGDTLPLAEPVEARDVVLLNGDADGFMGAIGAGLTPQISDFTHCSSFSEYMAQLADITPDIMGDEHIKYVVVDLSLPNKLIVDEVAPEKPGDWTRVAAAGMLFYRALSSLRGKMIIGNCQLKPDQTFMESDASRQASEARATGGERTTFDLDLYKGVGTPFRENASLIVSRDVKKEKAEGDAAGKLPRVLVYNTYTSGSKRLPTKSRFVKTLAPTLPGEMTLNAILRQAYGELL